MKQLASFADILDALHQVRKLDIDVGLESVGEKGVIWDYPPVVDLQQHYSLKKAFSLKKPSSGLKITSEAVGTRSIILASKVTTVCPKQGAIPYRA